MENNQERFLFTSESVTEGHPDKVCDQISDGILDAIYKQDSFARVAVETMATTNKVFISGEVTTSASVDYIETARNVIGQIGYNQTDSGFDAETVDIQSFIHNQSGDIAQGVNEGDGKHKEQGAGDQGLMFGYATNETPELMPLPILLAHQLTERLSEVRKNGTLPKLGPDGKSQVTVEYHMGKPMRVYTVVISNQHDADYTIEDVENDIREHVINPVCSEWIDENTVFHINPTGRFVGGGPACDTGLTGRKIIVDTYGGHGSHGGGAFSGKDPTKVDRSAAYMARYIAKNIVASSIADKCEVQLAYAIGVAEPVSVLTHCFGTNRISETRISELVRKYFPLKPALIINALNLRRPIYLKTASDGHFGRNDPDFTWENTDKAELLKKKAGELSEPVFAGEEVPLD
jgi:S-adenosylmethionine synthetase|tara:strand:- start:9636 stop:10850 length:1215 start_codon:yes stop_codon:yes gene_type:complete